MDQIATLKAQEHLIRSSVMKEANSL